jgi:hypothetical protein
MYKISVKIDNDPYHYDMKKMIGFLATFLHPIKYWYGFTESWEQDKNNIPYVNCLNLFFKDEEVTSKTEKIIEKAYKQYDMKVVFLDRGYVDLDVQGSTDNKDGKITMNSKFSSWYEGIELMDNIDWV